MAVFAFSNLSTGSTGPAVYNGPSEAQRDSGRPLPHGCAVCTHMSGRILPHCGPDLSFLLLLYRFIEFLA